MLKYTKIITTLPKLGQLGLATRQLLQFCTEQTSSTKKTYVMPEPPKKNRVYFTDRKVTFKNGRLLVYMNKQNLTTPFLLGMHFTVPLTYIAYLIYTNPCMPLLI